MAARAWLVCAGSILSLGLGNVLLKLGMERLDSLQAQGLGLVRSLAGAPALPVGIVLMIAQFVGMLTLFKWHWDVSVVVPVFGLNYVVTALLGRWWLGEQIDLMRWLGIAAVILGVALIARHAPAPGLGR